MKPVVNSSSFTSSIECQDNSRQAQRRALIYHVRVFDKITNKVAGYISNISDGGARLMSSKPIVTNQRRQFKIELPSRLKRDELGNVRSFEVDAVSTWSTDGENSGFYQSGFRFVDLDSAKKLLLEELMTKLHR